MAEIWEIASYVEEHPDDYPQRWRLAKKLYAAHEYRLALDHLQVLVKEWTPHLNVHRYLSASYYRLGRYAEALNQLGDTIAQWPDEIGPREQRAHVFKAAGKLPDALAAWEDVLAIQPEHALAKRYRDRLRVALAFDEGASYSSASDTHDIMNPEATEPPATGVVCSSCGANNSEDFESCWRCGVALLRHDGAFFNTPPIEAHGPYLLRPETIVTTAMLAIAALLAVALYLGFNLVMDYRALSDMPLRGPEDLWKVVLVPGRLVAGVAALLFWPVALTLAMRLLRVSPYPPAALVYITALCLGALTLVAFLLAPGVVLFAFGVTLFISFLVITVSFKFPVGVALCVWVVHIVLVWSVSLAAFWVVECYMFGEMVNPVTEVSAVRSVLSNPETLFHGGPQQLPGVETPIQLKLEWRSSGSYWVDARASMARFSARLEATGQDLWFQLYQDGVLRAHEELGMSLNIDVVYPIMPGGQYEVRLVGASHVPARVSVQSLLHFDIVE